MLSTHDILEEVVPSPRTPNKPPRAHPELAGQSAEQVLLATLGKYKLGQYREVMRWRVRARGVRGEAAIRSALKAEEEQLAKEVVAGNADAEEVLARAWAADGAESWTLSSELKEWRNVLEHNAIDVGLRGDAVEEHVKQGMEDLKQRMLHSAGRVNHGRLSTASALYRKGYFDNRHPVKGYSSDNGELSGFVDDLGRWVRVHYQPSEVILSPNPKGPGAIILGAMDDHAGFEKVELGPKLPETFLWNPDLSDQERKEAILETLGQTPEGRAALAFVETHRLQIVVTRMEEGGPVGEFDRVDTITLSRDIPVEQGAFYAYHEILHAMFPDDDAFSTTPKTFVPLRTSQEAKVRVGDAQYVISRARQLGIPDSFPLSVGASFYQWAHALGVRAHSREDPSASPEALERAGEQSALGAFQDWVESGDFYPKYHTKEWNQRAKKLPFTFGNRDAHVLSYAEEELEKISMAGLTAALHDSGVDVQFREGQQGLDAEGGFPTVVLDRTGSLYQIMSQLVFYGTTVGAIRHMPVGSMRSEAELVEKVKQAKRKGAVALAEFSWLYHQVTQLPIHPSLVAFAYSVAGQDARHKYGEANLELDQQQLTQLANADARGVIAGKIARGELASPDEYLDSWEVTQDELPIYWAIWKATHEEE